MTAQTLREQTKALLDTADERIVRLVHAMLQADAEEESDWWEALPIEARAGVEAAIAEADCDEVISHAELKARYPQWFSK